jgi:hypothetical protein
VEKLEHNDPENYDDARSAQLGFTGHYKVVKESFYFLCRRKSVNRSSLKSFFVELQRHVMRCVQNDIIHSRSLGYTDRLTIQIGVQQLAYNALKYSKDMSHDLKQEFLRTILREADNISREIDQKENNEDYAFKDQLENMEPATEIDQRSALFPFFDMFLDQSDLEGMEGGNIKLYSGINADLLDLQFLKPKSFNEANNILRQTQKLLVSLDEKKQQVRLHKRLVLLMLQRTFVNSLPVPLGPQSKENRNCIWTSQKVVYAQQQSVVALLASITHHVVGAAASLERDAYSHSFLSMILGAIAAIADAVLRIKSVDFDGGFSSALRAGFGTSSAIFSKQAEVYPLYDPSMLSLRADLLGYFR